MSARACDNAAVGLVLRELRGMTDLSARQASQRIGLTDAAVGMWERGERSITVERLIELAELYGVDPGLAVDLMSIRCGRAESLLPAEDAR